MRILARNPRFRRVVFIAFLPIMSVTLVLAGALEGLGAGIQDGLECLVDFVREEFCKPVVVSSRTYTYTITPIEPAEGTYQDIEFGDSGPKS